MKEKYLPIGTVVTLNGGTKRVMIIGYCPMTGENKVFDYSACTYPEGIVTVDKTLAFNHDQISKIDFMGLEDNEYTEFNFKIKEMLNGLNVLKNVDLPQNNVGTEKNNKNEEISTLDITPRTENINSSINTTQ